MPGQQISCAALWRSLPSGGCLPTASVRKLDLAISDISKQQWVLFADGARLLKHLCALAGVRRMIGRRTDRPKGNGSG